MKTATSIEKKIEAWRAADLIDAATAERLSAYEAAHERRAGLHWPVLIALLFGAILVATGILLFVAAHWGELSPQARFALVLAMVAAFHIGGAFSGEKFPALSTTLHGIGTATLGAGIFLAAQIFNLHENWSTGVLLWAVGAAAGYALLRDWVQASFVAILLPAWLIGEWQIATGDNTTANFPFAVGLVSLAIAYLSARMGDEASMQRRVMTWIGGLALLPATGIAAALAFDTTRMGIFFRGMGQPISGTTIAITWFAALVLPLALAVFLRGAAAWINVGFLAWTLAMLGTSRHLGVLEGRGGSRDPLTTSAMYLLLAVGAVGFVWWGMRERRRERINLGVAGFACAVVGFYFDNFMDKIGRSASLIVLGILCLAGGYALEKTRRRLVASMEAHP